MHCDDSWLSQHKTWDSLHQEKNLNPKLMMPFLPCLLVVLEYSSAMVLIKRSSDSLHGIPSILSAFRHFMGKVFINFISFVNDTYHNQSQHLLIYIITRVKIRTHVMMCVMHNALHIYIHHIEKYGKLPLSFHFQYLLVPHHTQSGGLRYSAPSVRTSRRPC